MFLKNDDLFVTIKETIFRAKKYTNPQFVFDPDAIIGFYDGVDIKRNTVSRPNQSGDFSEIGFFSNRKLTLTGTAIANSPAQLLDMRDQFTGLLTPGEYTEIAVQNSVDTRYITVTIDSQASWVQKVDNAAIWKLDLYAPDPKIYGIKKQKKLVDNTISGGVDYPSDYPTNYGGSIQQIIETVTNNGNTDSWPIFKVTGDFFSGFTISNNAGSLIKYDGMVTMSAPVYIDTAKGTATQSGTDKSTQLSIRDWFSIPPNTTIQPSFIPHQDSAGWCDIIYRDTWI